MIEPYLDIVSGFVCQSPSVVTSPGLIQLTPGVKLIPGTDDLGQLYVRPEIAVCEKGADIVVVGRGITETSMPEEVAEQIQKILWSSYETRIRTCT